MSDLVPLSTAAPLVRPPNRLYDIRRGVLRVAPTILLTLLILVLWEILVSVFNIQRFLLPPPSAILNAFSDHFPELMESAQMAVSEAAGGLILGTILAVSAGLIAVRWNVASRALIPFAIAFNAVPTLVFAPIMNNWFGSVNPLSKMMIVVTLVYYPIMINVVRGLTSVDPLALELIHSY